MSRLFYHVMQDNAGNLLFDVSGTMRLAGTGTAATIYGDEALTIPIANPMTNHPSFGSFKCFLGAGDYDFYMAKAGYTFETLTGVQGHGTMAQQDASAVAITGGTITNVTIATGYASTLRIQNLGIGLPATIYPVDIYWPKATVHGIHMRPSDGDAGSSANLVFANAGDAPVGGIFTTASATSYTTSSDARLKTAVQSLVGELAVIRALRPVRFRWLSDDSAGVGFLAGEVAEVVQGVVTGEPDAMEEDGVTIRPQQIDHSKLVPWLVGALQTLAAQVETLTERVTELEAGLGV